MLKYAGPPFGKLLPVMKASFDWLSPAPPKYCVGRMGPSEGPPGVTTDWPINGVHGNPVCQLLDGGEFPAAQNPGRDAVLLS